MSSVGAPFSPSSYPIRQRGQRFEWGRLDTPAADSDDYAAKVIFDVEGNILDAEYSSSRHAGTTE